MMSGPRSGMVNGPSQVGPQMNCGPATGMRMNRANSVMINNQGMPSNMVHMAPQHVGNIPHQSAMNSGQSMMQHPNGPPMMTRMVKRRSSTDAVEIF